MLKVVGWVLVAIAIVALALHHRAALLLDSKGGRFPDQPRTSFVAALFSFLIALILVLVHVVYHLVS